MEPYPLILTSFSRHEMIFREAMDDSSKASVRLTSPLLSVQKYVPLARYRLSLLEGDHPKAYLSGDLAGYRQQGDRVVLSFTITASESCPHGDFDLEQDKYPLWTCKLVAGQKYSLIVTPEEVVTPAWA